jgi:hypothetical protein
MADKQPTITSANLPSAKPPVVDNIRGNEASSIPAPPVQDFPVISDDMIEARPLVAEGWENIKYKNPNLAGRWIYCSGGKGNTRFDEAQATGYRVAKDTDCEVPGVPYRDGAFRKGDVILMVMDRNRYIGALKYKEQQSLLLSGRRDRTNQIRPAIRDPRTGESVLPTRRGKLEFFEPGKAELDRLESENSPDVPQSRSDILSQTVRQLSQR